MYLHVGADVMVRMEEVVGIFERESLLTGGASREYLGFARARKQVEDLSNGDPRSVVICRDRVLLSPISPATLRSRVGAYGRQPIA